MANKDYETLEQRFEQRSKLDHIAQTIDWDAQLYCPENAVVERGEQKALLNVQCHQLATLDDWAGIFARLEKADDLTDWQKANVRAAKRVWENESLLTPELIAESARVTTNATAAWFKARAENDFPAFKPHLEKLVDLQRRIAARKNKDRPYDALLDFYEAGVSEAFVDPLFDDLKTFLPDFIEKVRSRKERVPFEREYAIEKQTAFCRDVMRMMGFDMKRGRLDIAKTAFCTTLGIDDVRIVSHFHTHEPVSAIRAVMHETGHALYEQHLPRGFAHQPVGKQNGMAMHESQSLLMECLVCMSDEFQALLGQKMRDFYGFDELNPENLREKNFYVAPSFIRIDADEVTYPLHVILRYETEKDLIAERLDVADLPEYWNGKMRAYLGITPPTDTLGCLQDIHWSCGNFGYFPDYTLGVLAAHQFFEALLRDVPDALKEIGKGNFAPAVDWLTKHIYAQGSFDSFTQTVKNVTGKPLSTDAFKRTLQKRYGENK